MLCNSEISTTVFYSVYRYPYHTIWAAVA